MGRLLKITCLFVVLSILAGQSGKLPKPIIKEFVAAISAGIIEDQPILDLNFIEDSSAQVDANFVICESGKIAEIQVLAKNIFLVTNSFNQYLLLLKRVLQKLYKNKKKFFLNNCEKNNFFFSQ